MLRVQQLSTFLFSIVIAADAFGTISGGKDLCIDSSDASNLVLASCDSTSTSQMFVMNGTFNGTIQNTNGDCITVGGAFRQATCGYGGDSTCITCRLGLGDCASTSAQWQFSYFADGIAAWSSACSGGGWLQISGPQTISGQVVVSYGDSSWRGFQSDLCIWTIHGDCSEIQAVTGKWVPRGEFPAGGEVTFTHGVHRTYSQSVSKTWGASMTASVKAGFNIFGNSVSTTVSGEVSASLSSSYQSTFEMTQASAWQFDITIGTVWQWEFDSVDGCGQVTTQGKDLAITVGAYAPPCCLPNWFVNISNPHGACHPTSDGAIFSFCDGTAPAAELKQNEFGMLV